MSLSDYLTALHAPEVAFGGETRGAAVPGFPAHVQGCHTDGLQTIYTTEISQRYKSGLDLLC